MKKTKHTEAFIDQWISSGRYDEFGLFLSQDLILKIEEILFRNNDDKARKKIKKLLYASDTVNQKSEKLNNFPMKTYVSIRTMSANNLEKAVEKVIEGDFTEENTLCDSVLPEGLIHTCSSEKGRIFWMVEDCPSGERINHFCNLESIPDIWHENSHFQFRRLWNEAFTRISLHELNDMFDANRIEFRFE